MVSLSQTVVSGRMTNLALTQLWQAQLRLQADLFKPSMRRSLSSQNAARERSAELLDGLFLNLVKVAQPDLFVEAGAFDAETSLRIARTIPGCSVVAFEANPDNHAHFAGIRQFEQHGVQYLNLALTDTPGPIEFHVESKDGSTILGHSSTLQRSEASDRSVSPVTVEGVRLDDHTPEAARVAMWVDVEGAADQVLRGSPRNLAACDAIKVEVEEEEFWKGQALSTDLVSQLLTAGMVPVARDIEYPGQYNIVFASPRLLRERPAIEAIEAFLTSIREPTVWPVITRARANPLYGKASSAVRRTLGTQ